MSLLPILSIVTGFFEVICMNGAIFGWTFMQKILETEGYFGDQCFNETVNSTKLNITSLSFKLNCDEREKSLSLIYTLSVALLRTLAFPLGYCLDRFGTWKYRSALSALLIVGWILMTLSTPESSNMLYPAAILIGVAGYGFLLSNFQLANLAKSIRAVIVTLFQGLFGSSTVIFFSFKKGQDAGISVYLFFKIMIGITVFMFARTFLFMPIKNLQFPLDIKTVKYGWKEWKCGKLSKNVEKNSETETETEVRDRDKELPAVETIDKPIEKFDTQQSLVVKDSFKDCLRKPYLWSSVFHFSIISLRIDFFLGNIVNWLRTFSSDADASSLQDISGYILMCNVLAAPLNGAIVDLVVKMTKSTKNKEILNLKGALASMTCTTILVVILSIVVLIPSTFVSFVFLMLARAFIYGGITAFVALNFPSQHFGKVFGINSLFAGLANLLQQAFITISLTIDPNFVGINIALLVLSICTFVHPFIIYRTIKKLEK